MEQPLGVGRGQGATFLTAPECMETEKGLILRHGRREEVMAIVRREEGDSEILPPPDEKKWQQFQKEASLTIGDLYTTGLWPQSAPRRYTP